MFRHTMLLLGIALAPTLGCPSNDAPFAGGQTWTGTYTCRQGLTDLKLRIENVSGSNVEALFDFEHVKSGSKGVFRLAGTYDAVTRKITFMPGQWIGEHPPTYVTVGMSGEVSRDGRSFGGAISGPGCTTFSLSADPTAAGSSRTVLP